MLLMKLIVTDSALNECVDSFNRSSVTAGEVNPEGETLLLYLYRTKVENFIFDELRYPHIQESLRKNSSRLNTFFYFC